MNETIEQLTENLFKALNSVDTIDFAKDIEERIKERNTPKGKDFNKYFKVEQVYFQDPVGIKEFKDGLGGIYIPHKKVVKTR